jgi:hypothetical protein
MDKIESEIDGTKLTLDCKGGGRIEVDPATRSISVYGLSQVRYTFIDLRFYLLYFN